MFEIQSLPHTLFERRHASVLRGILRGVEREALRVDSRGHLATTDHPQALGSALAHPQITTDFSEALLEFITPPSHLAADVIQQLSLIQRFALSNMDDELLWSSSMPCYLGDHEKIPVARYGDSNNGKMKTVYRLGLGHRYGRAMQTVAGIHYNFSLPDAFWSLLLTEENSIANLRDFKSQRYFGAIRNFRQQFWLLIYLFGASPALCGSFINGKTHALRPLSDQSNTLFSPYGTSLRMGDLGYKSRAQESLFVCYNQQNTYIKTLCSAIVSSHTDYESIGERDAHGNYHQLNTGLLQIENEFYSAIRPKRTAHPGETALKALSHRGVEYIEVRCLDVDPFSAEGITEDRMHFLDTFLVYCALKESPFAGKAEWLADNENQKRVVNEGRKPGLTLTHPERGEISLQSWGNALFDAMAPAAEMLDIAFETQRYSDILKTEREKLSNPALTPSAQIIRQLNDDNISYFEFAKAQSSRHKDTLLKTPLSNTEQARMQAMAEKSLQEQYAIEAKSDEPFEQFLKNYYQQYDYCSGCNEPA